MPALPDRTQLAVRVTPNARRSEFAGWTADEKGRPVLLVKLQAPPVEGKANTELIRFLAKALGCSKSEIVLLRGDSSRQKSLEIPASAMAALLLHGRSEAVDTKQNTPDRPLTRSSRS